MRIVGFILLVGGFLFLSGNAAMSKKGSLVVMWKHSKELPKQENFTRDQVDNAISRVAFDMSRHISFMAWPAVVMLGGGILLDRARHRKKSPD